MGLAINPRANNARTAAYRRPSGLFPYHAYAHMVSIQNSVLRTSFRSETQATDST